MNDPSVTTWRDAVTRRHIAEVTERAQIAEATNHVLLAALEAALSGDIDTTTKRGTK